MNNQTWQIRRMESNISTVLMIRGGHVIDPANDFDDIADVLIVDGKNRDARFNRYACTPARAWARS